MVLTFWQILIVLIILDLIRQIVIQIDHYLLQYVKMTIAKK